MTTEHPTQNSATENDRADKPRLSAQEEALLAIFDGADPFTEGGAPGADPSDLEVLGGLATLVEPKATAQELSHGKAALFARLEASTGSTSGAMQRASTAGGVLSFPGAQPNSTNSRWIPLALAATALLAVGLAVWSSFLFSEVRQMRTLVAGLESELDQRVRQASAVDFQQVVLENTQLRQQIGVATKRDTRICALSAVGDDQPEAAATVFLRPEQNEWVIATSNLAKCPLGRRYRVWFLGSDGAILGSQMLDHINGDKQIETASGELPRGAASILVTLEHPDRLGKEPGGARVLYGDRTVEIY